MINRNHLNRDRAPGRLLFLELSGAIAGAVFLVALGILTHSLYKKPPTMPHSEREIQNMMRDIANGKTSGQLSPSAMLCIFKMVNHGKKN